jgi:hypothetical protein
MGYCITQTESSFFIPKEHFHSALESIKPPLPTPAVNSAGLILIEYWPKRISVVPLDSFVGGPHSIVMGISMTFLFREKRPGMMIPSLERLLPM